MAYRYLFDPNIQFLKKDSTLDVDGALRVYFDGTDDIAPTCSDMYGTLNPFPVVIDNDGRAVVIVDDSHAYRLEVYDDTGALLWTVTGLTAGGSGGMSAASIIVKGVSGQTTVATYTDALSVTHYVVGLADTGVTAGTYGDTGGSRTIPYGGSFAIHNVILDAKGRATSAGSETLKLPAAQALSGAALNYAVGEYTGMYPHSGTSSSPWLMPIIPSKSQGFTLTDTDGILSVPTSCKSMDATLELYVSGIEGLYNLECMALNAYFGTLTDNVAQSVQAYAITYDEYGHSQFYFRFHAKLFNYTQSTLSVYLDTGDVQIIVLKAELCINDETMYTIQE